MKKYIYPILFAISGSIIIGIGGMLKLATYGGNNCDFANKNCDCFCCN
jgi:hypothetical protein